MKKVCAYIVIFAVVLSNFVGFSQVEAKTRARKIELNCKKKTLRVGQKYKLKIKKVTPKNGTKKVVWKSSNKKIATVSKGGMVKAKKVGKVKITAYSKQNKRVLARCNITVIRKKDKVKKTIKTPQNTEAQQKTPKVTSAPTREPGNEIKATATPGTTATPNTTATPGTTAMPNTTATPTVAPSDDPDQEMVVVTFLDCDGTELKKEKIKKGTAATPPNIPKRIGYIFSGWDKDYSNVTENVTIRALYEKDNARAIIVGDVVVNKDEKEVFVPVYVNQNPGILGMTLAVLYNDEKLQLLDAITGDALSDVLTFTKANVLKSNCRFTWDGQDIQDQDVKDGQILVLKFGLKENIEPGDYDINIYYNEGDIVDRDLQPIQFELRSGKVTVK